MSTSQREQQISRETILNLLTNDEMAKVSNSEEECCLKAGDEYLDLSHLELGIQRAQAETKVIMGHLLTREAVSDETWAKIVGQLKHCSI